METLVILSLILALLTVFTIDIRQKRHRIWSKVNEDEQTHSCDQR